MPQANTACGRFLFYIFDAISYPYDVVDARLFDRNVLNRLFLGQVVDKRSSGQLRLEELVARHIVIC